MNNFPDNAAYERIVQELFRKQSQKAFQGIMAMLWATHDVERIRAMLLEQVEYCNEVL